MGGGRVLPCFCRNIVIEPIFFPGADASGPPQAGATALQTATEEVHEELGLAFPPAGYVHLGSLPDQ